MTLMTVPAECFIAPGDEDPRHTPRGNATPHLGGREKKEMGKTNEMYRYKENTLAIPRSYIV